MASTLTNLLVHVVFSTKGRETTITDEYREKLHNYIGIIIRGEGAQPLSVGGMPDHIHIAMKYKSNQALSDMVRKIKANSSKWVNQKRFIKKRFAWQNGYGGFSISVSQVDKVRIYIMNQAEHHRTRTFKEELVQILEKHGIDYDPEYLWD